MISLIPIYSGCGILEALRHAGDLAGLTNQQIADLVEWQGDADRLVNELIETGWLHNDGKKIHV